MVVVGGVLNGCPFGLSCPVFPGVSQGDLQYCRRLLQFIFNYFSSVMCSVLFVCLLCVLCWVVPVYVSPFALMVIFLLSLKQKPETEPTTSSKRHHLISAGPWISHQGLFQTGPVQEPDYSNRHEAAPKNQKERWLFKQWARLGVAFSGLKFPAGWC